MSRQRFPVASLPTILLSLLFVLLAPASALAQTITATINGTVTDPMGAVVTNAKVVITSVATGQIKAATNYVISDIASFKRDLFAVRIDQTVSDRHSFFGRYSREARNQAEPTFLGSVATNSRVIQDDFHNFTFNDVYSFSPL